ncbi:hypothetical protein K456DRAFT_32430 [Colletotrichum gloeosporioides 23]|nr:hypothetical protein K456DRAFT_32430 [Colletotrichum gloeosporioides 23]
MGAAVAAADVGEGGERDSMRETSRDRTAATGKDEERTERRERRAWPSEGGNVETLIGYGTGGQAGPGQAPPIWANRRPPAPNGSPFTHHSSQVRSLVRDGGEIGMEEDWSPRPPACCPLTRSPARSLSASTQAGWSPESSRVGRRAVPESCPRATKDAQRGPREGRGFRRGQGGVAERRVGRAGALTLMGAPRCLDLGWIKLGLGNS